MLIILQSYFQMARLFLDRCIRSTTRIRNVYDDGRPEDPIPGTEIMISFPVCFLGCFKYGRCKMIFGNAVMQKILCQSKPPGGCILSICTIQKSTLMYFSVGK
jgi:hypothetical protein